MIFSSNILITSVYPDSTDVLPSPAWPRVGLGAILDGCGHEMLFDPKYKRDYKKPELLGQIAEGLKYLYGRKPPIIYGLQASRNVWWQNIEKIIECSQ